MNMNIGNHLLHSRNTCPSQNRTITRSQFGLNLLQIKQLTVAIWYRPPVDRPDINGHLPESDNGNDLLNSLEKFDNLFSEQLDKINNIN